MTERYINPFTDFGFKKLFGEESNKELLIDFLSELLPEKGRIKSLRFLKNEQLGSTPTDRKAIFDLYCENEKGEKFIVELQKAKQKYFKDRSLYYSSFAIQEQARTGEWDFHIQAVYSISIMDFVFDELKAHTHKFVHDIRLIDIQTKQVFNETLRFMYLEMPKFTKTIDQLETRFDKWMYILKNLVKLDEVPEKLRERIFLKFFKAAEIARYTPQEQQAYKESVKIYRDWKNVMDTVYEEAYVEAEKKTHLRTAQLMKQNGESIEKIIQYTNLSRNEIEDLN